MYFFILCYFFLLIYSSNIYSIAGRSLFLKESTFFKNSEKARERFIEDYKRYVSQLVLLEIKDLGDRRMLDVACRELSRGAEEEEVDLRFYMYQGRFVHANYLDRHKWILSKYEGIPFEKVNKQRVSELPQLIQKNIEQKYCLLEGLKKEEKRWLGYELSIEFKREYLRVLLEQQRAINPQEKVKHLEEKIESLEEKIKCVNHMISKKSLEGYFKYLVEKNFLDFFIKNSFQSQIEKNENKPVQMSALELLEYSKTLNEDEFRALHFKEAVIAIKRADYIFIDIDGTLIEEDERDEELTKEVEEQKAKERKLSKDQIDIFLTLLRKGKKIIFMTSGSLSYHTKTVFNQFSKYIPEKERSLFEKRIALITSDGEMIFVGDQRIDCFWDEFRQKKRQKREVFLYEFESEILATLTCLNVVVKRVHYWGAIRYDLFVPESLLNIKRDIEEAINSYFRKKQLSVSVEKESDKGNQNCIKLYFKYYENKKDKIEICKEVLGEGESVYLGNDFRDTYKIIGDSSVSGMEGMTIISVDYRENYIWGQTEFAQNYRRRREENSLPLSSEEEGSFLSPLGRMVRGSAEGVEMSFRLLYEAGLNEGDVSEEMEIQYSHNEDMDIEESLNEGAEQWKSSIIEVSQGSSLTRLKLKRKVSDKDNKTDSSSKRLSLEVDVKKELAKELEGGEGEAEKVERECLYDETMNIDDSSNESKEQWESPIIEVNQGKNLSRLELKRKARDRNDNRKLFSKRLSLDVGAKKELVEELLEEGEGGEGWIEGLLKGVLEEELPEEESVQEGIESEEGEMELSLGNPLLLYKNSLSQSKTVVSA